MEQLSLWGSPAPVVAPVFSSPVRVAVLGSRSFAAPALVSSFVASLPRGSVVLSGGCPSGADAVARSSASASGLSFVGFPAPFGAVGPSAGPRRSAALLRSLGPVGCPLCAPVAVPVAPSSWLSLRAGSAPLVVGGPSCPACAGSAVVGVAACVVFSGLGPSSPGSVAAVAAARRAGVACWVCSPSGVWARG